ncbi:hypothetical protein [Caballeronia udeis]|uniref:hypothetical protein n=1 Tax=Caballeronia udeis TaxID=1232866 RepID=UPI0012E80A22|nr:hypothetical protein [Caballeronia udeis]
MTAFKTDQANLRITPFDDPLQPAFRVLPDSRKPSPGARDYTCLAAGNGCVGVSRFHVESVALDASGAKAKPQNIGCFELVTTTYSTNEYVMQERISSVKMQLRGRWTQA